MGQHAQAIREKHTARNVTLIVLAVLIVLLAIAAGSARRFAHLGSCPSMGR